MAIAMLLLLLLSSAALLFTRRTRETLCIFALNVVLAEFWVMMLIYISKKGGFGAELQTLLFGTREIRLWLQYRVFTLRRMGYLLAVGRFLFPMVLMWLAMMYCKRVQLRERRWLLAAAAALPGLSLLVYYPAVFEWVIARHPGLIDEVVNFSLGWIVAYLLGAAALMAVEYKDITMAFYRRRFLRKAAMVLSLEVLYALYAPQDPAQVYLFYRNEYMGAIRGLWYLSPALSLMNYLIVFGMVLAGTAGGIITQLKYAQNNIRDGQEDVSIRTKFDAASKGASVFVHSVKNQLLANRVLLKRMDASLNQPSPDIAQIRAYHQQLVANNSYMVERMEELYKSIRTNAMELVAEPLQRVCDQAMERLMKKYPAAAVRQAIPEDTLILCDRNHMSEALYNLLLNGWEAQISVGRQGEPLELMVSQERMWTVLEVRDHGQGIPKAQLRHLFDPFYSSKNSNLNWGMGLYYVRQIVKSHLGVLRIDTRLGQGSTFLIQLPRYDAKARNQRRECHEI